jgi:hypothetical protein
MPPRNKTTGAKCTHLLSDLTDSTDLTGLTDLTDSTGITGSTDQTEQKLALIFTIEEVREF